MNSTDKRNTFRVSGFILKFSIGSMIFFGGLLLAIAALLFLKIITPETFNAIILNLPIGWVIVFLISMVAQRKAMEYEMIFSHSEMVAAIIKKGLDDVDFLLSYPNRNIELILDAARKGVIFLENIAVPIKKEDISVDAEKIRAYLEAQKAEMENEMKKVVFPPKPKFYRFIEEKILKSP